MCFSFENRVGLELHPSENLLAVCAFQKQLLQRGCEEQDVLLTQPQTDPGSSAASKVQL